MQSLKSYLTLEGWKADLRETKRDFKSVYRAVTSRYTPQNVPISKEVHNYAISSRTIADLSKFSNVYSINSDKILSDIYQLKNEDGNTRMIIFRKLINAV